MTEILSYKAKSVLRKTCVRLDCINLLFANPSLYSEPNSSSPAQHYDTLVASYTRTTIKCLIWSVYVSVYTQLEKYDISTPDAYVNIISNPTPALVNPTPALLNTTPGRRFFAPHYRKRRYGAHSFYL